MQEGVMMMRFHMRNRGTETIGYVCHAPAVFDALPKPLSVLARDFKQLQSACCSHKHLKPKENLLRLIQSDTKTLDALKITGQQIFDLFQRLKCTVDHQTSRESELADQPPKSFTKFIDRYLKRHDAREVTPEKTCSSGWCISSRQWCRLQLHNHVYRVCCVTYSGAEECPILAYYQQHHQYFGYDWGNRDWFFYQEDTAECLHVGDLLPFQIKNFEFFQGEGSEYRVSPEKFARFFHLQPGYSYKVHYEHVLTYELEQWTKFKTRKQQKQKVYHYNKFPVLKSNQWFTIYDPPNQNQYVVITHRIPLGGFTTETVERGELKINLSSYTFQKFSKQKTIQTRYDHCPSDINAYTLFSPNENFVYQELKGFLMVYWPQNLGLVFLISQYVGMDNEGCRDLDVSDSSSSSSSSDQGSDEKNARTTMKYIQEMSQILEMIAHTSYVDSNGILTIQTITSIMTHGAQWNQKYF
jgi:hypothetical protein